MTRTLPLGIAASVVVFAFATPCFAQITGKHLDETPEVFVDRPLTLPKMHAYGDLNVTFNHIEASEFDGAFNGSLIEIGGALGILDDLEVEAALFSLATEEISFWPMGFDLIDRADWGMSRFGVTLRFVAEEAIELGGRFRFLIDNNATIGLAGGMPIRVHAGNVFRLDTGIAWIGRLPTSGGDPAFQLTDVSNFPSAPDAGIPLRFYFQLVPEVFLGFNTGFGATDVAIDETIFLPLGATLGGTVHLDKDLFLDIAGAFLFPGFILPAGDDTDEIIGSELWQVGLTGKFYFPLPK